MFLTESLIRRIEGPNDRYNQQLPYKYGHLPTLHTPTTTASVTFVSINDFHLCSAFAIFDKYHILKYFATYNYHCEDIFFMSSCFKCCIFLCVIMGVFEVSANTVKYVIILFVILPLQHLEI